MSLLHDVVEDGTFGASSLFSFLHELFLPHDNLHRDLTYLDTDDQDVANGVENETVSDLGSVIAFSVMAALFFFVMVVVIRINSTCHEFYEWNAIRLLLPTVASFLCIETATLAFEAARTTVSHQWAIAVFMLSSTIAPGIFLFTFVITFLAYRTRSMPFCFVYRGPGRQATAAEPWRDDEEEVLQPLVRPAVLIVAIRLFALGLVILSLVVNFDVVWTEQDLAGRTGWWTVFQGPNNVPGMDHIILGLLPMALVSLCCLYFSFLLWRYGCDFSLVIYGTGIFNPWISPVFGTAAMIVGQFFGPDLFLITSNAGILIFMLSIARILFEERRDLEVAGELGKFLDALGNDNVTRTQCGVEKSTPDDDTLSSGQHQQWMLHETKAEIPSSPIERQASKEFMTIDTNQMLPLYDQDDRMASMMQATRQNSFASAASNSQRQRSLRPRSSASTVSVETTLIANTSKSAPPESAAPIEEKGQANDADHETDSDPIVQRVHGIVKRPEKLRRGQRPKGRYIVQ